MMNDLKVCGQSSDHGTIPKVGHAWHSDGAFPLTPALSLGERGSPWPSPVCSKRHKFADALATILPLPKGEGWGEGEQSVLRSQAFPIHFTKS